MLKKLSVAALVLAAAASLSGCAVYGPDYGVSVGYIPVDGYYGPDGYYYSPGVYVDHYYAPGWYHGRYWEGRRWSGRRH